MKRKDIKIYEQGLKKYLASWEHRFQRATFLEMRVIFDQFLQTPKSEVPSLDSSHNLGLGLFYRDTFFNRLPTHTGWLVIYLADVSFNKSCFSVSVGIKKGYQNSCGPKYDPEIRKKGVNSLDSVIMQLRKKSKIW